MTTLNFYCARLLLWQQGNITDKLNALQGRTPTQGWETGPAMQGCAAAMITDGARAPLRPLTIAGKVRALVVPAMAPQALWLALILALLCTCGAAQQPDQSAATPDAPSTSRQEETKPPATMSTVQSGAEFVSILQRKSRVFPNLATSAGPLSQDQKLKLAVNNSLALSSWIAALLSAGINQASNRPAGYGEGAEGFPKRLAAAMARRSSSQIMGTYLLASALHQDPRFFVRNDLKLGGSIKYSIRRVFVTRSDSGEHVFNWSGLLGMLGSEGLANAYYPDSFRTAGNTFSRFGYDMAGNAAGNLLRQYWPRINRKLMTPKSAATKP